MTDEFPRALSGASQVKNRQKRGYALEKLVQELFERAHFNVTPNSRVASPRQTDLLAVRGPAGYLIECKWQKQPAHIGDVDALRSRLERTSSNTTGLLVSVSGFTAGAMDLVESRRERPLVLVTHRDLTDLCREPERLVRMLDAKLANLVDDARVSPVTTASRRTRRSAPPPLSTFRSLSGEALPVIEGDGDYAPFVYAPEISDIDWVRGSGVGVSLDLRADVSSQLALLDLLHDLTRLGWSTPSARWSFRQGTKEWHGCGAGEFALAFKEWAARTDSLTPVFQ